MSGITSPEKLARDQRSATTAAFLAAMNDINKQLETCDPTGEVKLSVPREELAEHLVPALVKRLGAELNEAGWGAQIEVTGGYYNLVLTAGKRRG